MDVIYDKFSVKKELIPKKKDLWNKFHFWERIFEFLLYIIVPIFLRT